MNCNGIDFASREHVAISFDSTIAGVDHLLAPVTDEVFVAPGFIDLQVNGFAGVDYNDPETKPDELAKSIRRLFATGVTRFFPTVITGSPERMSEALRMLAAARESIPEGHAMEAFHVEGPYISPEDGPRGAHPRRWVRPPDIGEFRRFQQAARGHIRLMTLSPEWENAPAFIEQLVNEGVVVSIGHTNATAPQIAEAVRAGATLSTHIGNGAHATLDRHPNYIWEQLAEDRLNASLIVDGIHLGPAFLKVALRAKGVERAVLISDAVMPAGCTPGHYKLGEVDVELHADGSVRLLGGTRLAGSVLSMDRAVENVMRLADMTLRDAVTMASRNPARVGRIASRQRGLAPGERADLVRFRYNQKVKQVEIIETYLSGEPVFQARTSAG